MAESAPLVFGFALLAALVISTQSAFAQAPAPDEDADSARGDHADGETTDAKSRELVLTELVDALDAESASERADALAELSRIVTEDDWPVLEALYRKARVGSQEILLSRVLLRSGWIPLHERERVAEAVAAMRSKDATTRREALWTLLTVPNGERVIEAELARAPGELQMTIDRVPFAVTEGQEVALTVRMRNADDKGFWVWLAPLWGRLTMQASYMPLGPYAFANVSRRHGASTRAHHWAAREVNELVEFQWLEPGDEIVSKQLYTNTHRLGRVELLAVYDCVRTRIHVERSRSTRLPFSADYAINAWRGALTAKTTFHSVTADRPAWKESELRGVRLRVSNVEVVTFDQVEALARRFSVPGLGAPAEANPHSPPANVTLESKTVYRNPVDHRDLDEDRPQERIDVPVAGVGEPRAIGFMATLTAQNRGDAAVKIRDLKLSVRETVLAIVRNDDGEVLAIAPAMLLDRPTSGRQPLSQTLMAGDRAEVNLLVPVQLAAGTYRVQIVLLDLFREAARNPVDVATATVTVTVEE